MLKRQQIRRYMLALLCSDGVNQGVDGAGVCDQGMLWENCDGENLPVLDHESHQIAADIEGSVDTSPDSAAISFKHNRVKYNLLTTSIDSASFNFQIDIIAFGKSGPARADICDTIEERILYRLLSYQSFIAADTGETLVSFLRQVDNNSAEIEVRDDQSFDGNYTIREMEITFVMKECIRKPDCDDEVLCFDFKDLTVLDKDA